MSIRYSERVEEAGLLPSVGSFGDSSDNALAETINSLYKIELIRLAIRGKPFKTWHIPRLEWVNWFNHRKLLEPTGYRSSVDYEVSYDESSQESAKAA